MKTQLIAALGLLGFFAIACGTQANPGTQTDRGDAGAPVFGDDDDDLMPITNTCCVNGQFFACPNATACFGGFDLEGCEQACTDAKCMLACVDQLRNAGPPKGCTKATPPASVQCGN